MISYLQVRQSIKLVIEFLYITNSEFVTFVFSIVWYLYRLYGQLHFICQLSFIVFLLTKCTLQIIFGSAFTSLHIIGYWCCDVVFKCLLHFYSSNLLSNKTNRNRKCATLNSCFYTKTCALGKKSFRCAKSFLMFLLENMSYVSKVRHVFHVIGQKCVSDIFADNKIR